MCSHNNWYHSSKELILVDEDLVESERSAARGFWGVSQQQKMLIRQDSK